MLLWVGAEPLVRALGAEEAARVRRDAVAAAPGLLAQLPEFGDRSGARTFVTGAAMLVAFRRALPDHDATEATALLRQCLFRAAQRVPRWVKRAYRALFFSPSWYRRVVATTIGGGEDGFDGVLDEPRPGEFAVTYHRCGIQHWLRAVGASELAPHVCSLDEVESAVFDLGLERTGTLGRGATACDFRWRRPVR